MFRHVFLDLFRRSGLNPKHGPRKIALRALEGELALPQNRNPVAQGLDLGRIVATEKQRDLLPCGKVPKKLPDLAFPLECRVLWLVRRGAEPPGGARRPGRVPAASSFRRRTLRSAGLRVRRGPNDRAIPSIPLWHLRPNRLEASRRSEGTR